MQGSPGEGEGSEVERFNGGGKGNTCNILNNKDDFFKGIKLLNVFGCFLPMG